MEPTADVVGHPVTAHLPNESNERLLNEIVRGVLITDRGEGKGLELGGMRVEGRLDDRAKSSTRQAPLPRRRPHA